MANRIIFFVFFLFANSLGNAQRYTLQYSEIQHGKQTAVKKYYYQQQQFRFQLPADSQQTWIDFKTNSIQQITHIQQQAYHIVTLFDSLAKPQYLSDTIHVLSFVCKHARFISFSNTIDVWYTSTAPCKGSPHRRFLPDKQALVTKLQINGDYELKLIDLARTDSLLTYANNYTSLPSIAESVLEAKRIRARYHTWPIFQRNQIHYKDIYPVFNPSKAIADSVYHTAKGTIILKKIKWPSYYHPGDQVIARLQVQSNGDAYDRTGSVFVIPESKMQNILRGLQFGPDSLPSVIGKDGKKYQGIVPHHTYETPIEWMRFFTSFGAGYYHTQRPIDGYAWQPAALYSADISDLIPYHADTTQQSYWIACFIGNYDAGGHIVDLALDIFPGENQTTVLPVCQQSLCFMVNVMEMTGQTYGQLFKTDTLHTTFNIPENIQQSHILYTVTGHGGWGGGDEFNKKLNRILIDGKPYFSIYPWRGDCASYRLYNPASGNFENGMSSSDFSRSNWCPGTLTLPYHIPLTELSPGQHTLSIIIEHGADEGGSFSSWNVSATLIGYPKQP